LGKVFHCLSAEHGNSVELLASAQEAGVAMSTAEQARGGELLAVRQTEMKKVLISSVIGTAVERASSDWNAPHRARGCDGFMC
jgi:hypothetical protein